MVENNQLLSRIVLMHKYGGPNLIVDVEPRRRLVKSVAKLHVDTVHPTFAPVPKVHRDGLKALSLLRLVDVLHDAVKKLLPSLPIFALQVRTRNRIDVPELPRMMPRDNAVTSSYKRIEVRVQGASADALVIRKDQVHVGRRMRYLLLRCGPKTPQTTSGQKR